MRSMAKGSVLVSAALALGCGVQFDPPTELKTLRVMAVQKQPAYARPGETVDMSLLWHDGREEPGSVQRAWIGGCFNPPGDLYFGCFSQLGAQPGAPAFSFDFGDRFSFTMPADIVTSRPPPPDPSFPPYGLAVVFFAVCGGTLDVVVPEGDSFSFPLICRGEDGKPLGTEHFVAGYSMVYAYGEVENDNPVIERVSVAGVDLEPDCIGDACIDTPIAAPDCAASPEKCIAVCGDDGEDSCPSIEVRPVLDPDSFDLDDVQTKRAGQDVGEQMWLNYYVDRGSVSNGVRLVNDAVEGFNPQLETQLRAPAAPGPLSVWSVVHDNRGGVNWARVTLSAQ